MKKLYTILALIATVTIFAQAPQGFNYQATVRNSTGSLIVNQNVNFKFNIMLNSATSLPIFSETHMAPTDDLGHINLIIGQGTATIGSFSTINWANGNYYLGIELNTGSGYVAMGTTQLLSVPYALYANSSGNSQSSIPNLASVLAVNNGANNLQIKNLADPTDAQDAVTKAYSEAQLQAQVSQLQTQIEVLQNNNSVQLPFVKIGTQIWNVNNLNTTTYRDGTPIPQVQDPSQWANLTTGAWCYANNDASGDLIFGKLYNWYAVAGIHDNDPSTPNKILAPTGWHIPSDTEWNTLINFLGGENIAGNKMKDINYFNGTTNISGFSAVPSGYRSNGTGNFLGWLSSASWWTSTENGSNNAYGKYILSNFPNLYSYNNFKTDGFSVRCIKD